MKPIFQTMSIIGIMMLSNFKVHSQISVVGHTGASSDYAGWDDQQSFSLKIKHEAAQPINFYTNAGDEAFNNQRMTIFDGSGTPFNAGYVGIGIVSPQNLLHVNTGSNALYSQFTNSATNNNSSTTGFLVGIDANGNAILNSNYSSSTNGNMNFYTAGSTTPPRMTIIGSSTANIGYVGINIASPQNLLHIAGGSNASYSQFTNTTTSNSSTDGFLVGVDASGNAILNSKYSHSTNGNMNFYTVGDQRMTILGNTTNKVGFVGIGTTFPLFKFHIHGDGGILSTGNSLGGGATLPNGLSGPRLIWYPKKAAFRVGDGLNWDDGAIGNYSFACGASEANGTSSTAMGSSGAIGNYSTGMGSSTVAGNYATAMGQSYAWGNYATAMGGGSTQAGGDYCMAMGFNSYALGKYSAAMGYNAESFGDNSFAMGYFTKAHGTNSFAMGAWSDALAQNTVTIGFGISSSQRITNNISNSLMVGFNSNLPTLYIGVGPSVGVGTTGYVGIGTTGPTNKLEINSDATSANPGTTGLTFTDMNSTNSIPQTTNPFSPPAFLSVDSDGDVILVEDDGGDVSACITPAQNRLTKWDAGTNVLCNTIVHEDAQTRIGIAIYNGPLRGKLHVNNSTEATGVFVLTTTASAAVNTGILGNSNGSSNTNIGARGTASNTPNTFTTQQNSNIGAYGQAFSTNRINYGGRFEADGAIKAQGGRNYGIHASASSLLGFSVAGYFQGKVVATGTITGGSDIMLKDSIEDISSALSTLYQLEPKSFVFKTGDYPYMNLPTGRNFGFIAQQVDTILPELVDSIMNPEVVDTNGNVLESELAFLGLNYIGLIPLLVSGINELSEKTITSCTTPTDSNYIPKWSAVNQTLCNSIVYDNGNQIGISTTEPVSKATILNGSVPDAFSSIIAELEEDFDVTITSGNIALTVFSKTGDTINIGSMFIAENDEAVNIGGGSSANGDDAIINLGWVSSASGTQVEKVNVALLGTGSGEGSANYGVAGQAEGGAESIGVYGLAETDSVGYGIYGDVDGSSPDLYAGWFNGDVTVTGTFHNPSDAKLKDNVEDISNAMNLLNELQPKNFEYKTSAYEDLNLPEGNQHGLIAQEVEAVLPELVRDIISPTPRDKNGKATGQPTEYKGVNYTGFIPLLIKGIQEQQAVIDSMSKRLAEVESRVDNCCGGTGFKTSGDGDVNHLTVELTNIQTVILQQNVPNPFAEQTSISYFIPEDNEGQAQVIFFDITGRVIKTVDVQKGYGIITVFAHNLSTGSYSYSLMLDGKAVETKRMVKMK